MEDKGPPEEIVLSRDKAERIIREWAFEELPTPIIKDMTPIVLWNLLDRLVPLKQPKATQLPVLPDEPESPIEKSAMAKYIKKSSS